MGKKRTSDDSEEIIQRKIRKLKNKLKTRRRRIISSSEDESNSPHGPLSEAASPIDECSLPFSPIPLQLSPVPPPEPPLSPSPGPSTALLPKLSSAPPPMQPSTVAPTMEPSTAQQLEPERPVILEEALDDETLRLLGEAPEPEIIYGKSVHKDIAARWREILKKGLSKETKEILFKEYSIPANCELLVPPLLNPEAKAALTENFIKRDTSMVSRQKHLSVAVAALTQTIDKIINDRENQTTKKKNLLKPISDACRILCDMHHYETETRKRFVISSTNSELKEALINSRTDKFLFGENMSDKLKVAKTVQKSGEALKVTLKPTNHRTSVLNNAYNNKNRGNFKVLHQRRPDAGKTQMGPRHQPAYPRGRAIGRSALPTAMPPPLPPPLPPPRRSTRR